MKPPRVGRRVLLTGGVGTLVALGGATVWGLDRYVVDHVEVDEASSLTATKASAAPAATTGKRTGNSYKSTTATIMVNTIRSGSGDDRITSFVADIRVTHATIVRSAFANDKFGRNITANTSDIAADAKAVLAINGDYCGFRDDGIIIRNGVVFRDKGARPGLAFYTDGSARLYEEKATTADKLIDAGVWNTVSFGPGLVKDGKVLPGIDSYEISDFGPRPAGAPGSIQGNQPRTGIGIVGKNHLVMIVVAGRGADGSRGASMPEFAKMFVDAGCATAYNLDGGGSSTMVFGGKVVNEPAWRGGQQRGTSDILYVAG
jgi:exopolysaccharide biosynthesis protein